MVAGKLDTRLSVETLQTTLSIYFYVLNVLPLYLNLFLFHNASGDFWVYTSKGQMSEHTSFVSFALKEHQLYSNYSVKIRTILILNKQHKNAEHEN